LAGARRKNVKYLEPWFFNKLLYQHAAKAWRVYLLNELERFSKRPRHPRQNDTAGFNAEIDWSSHRGGRWPEDAAEWTWRFFRRFGMPDYGMPNDEGTPDHQSKPHGQFVTGQGSGFFITADGYAVTNNHVVDKAKAVEITTDDGKTYDAEVIGTDPRTELALIKVDGRSDFPFVKLADTTPRIGDWVVAGWQPIRPRWDGNGWDRFGSRPLG
jgi:S1-C subfamily serine protease